MIADSAGNIVHTQQTDPYGNVEQMVSTLPDEVNYTGKKLDKATGLYYFNQRYYDPDLGRFITTDPAGQSLNPYQYCANNPMKFVDPDGQFFGLDDFFIAMAWAAADSAAIDAGMQLVSNGWDVSKIGWDHVGQSAFNGAIMGGIGYGVDQAFSSSGISFGSKCINDGVKAGASDYIYATAMGNDYSVASFADSFAEGVISSHANDVYTKQVGWDADPIPGGAASATKYPNTNAVKGANNCWVPLGQVLPSWLKWTDVTQVIPGMNGLLREGGPLSIFCNLIPGVNAIATLHDSHGDLGFPNTVYSFLFYDTPLTSAALYRQYYNTRR